MLSYRHIFHAGNHADVLKHATLVHLLRYMAQKDKPFWYVDTHAGAVSHALRDPNAQKNAEFQTGIAPLWGRRDLPDLIKAYLSEVGAVNPDGKLRRYPGSAQFALQILRDDDRLRLFEMHTTESQLLTRAMRNYGKRVQVHAGNGFDLLKSTLPPPPRRAVVLIDPSYEDKRDYARVLVALKDALTRFKTGVYAIWYPQVYRLESHQMADRLIKLGAENWLHVTLSVSAPPRDGVGLYGSGMFIINPPYTLRAELELALPWLLDVLGQDDDASWTLDWQES